MLSKNRLPRWIAKYQRGGEIARKRYESVRGYHPAALRACEELFDVELGEPKISGFVPTLTNSHIASYYSSNADIILFGLNPKPHPLLSRRATDVAVLLHEESHRAHRYVNNCLKERAMGINFHKSDSILDKTELGKLVTYIEGMAMAATLRLLPSLGFGYFARVVSRRAKKRLAGGKRNFMAAAGRLLDVDTQEFRRISRLPYLQAYDAMWGELR